MAKKRRVSKKKITVFIIIIILIIAAIIGAVILLNKDNHEDTIKVESVDKIKGYDYELQSNATKYYSELFGELKEVLEADDIDEAKYAEVVTKLFVADFFNLDNKLSKNEVGGLQFVYKDFRNDFVKLASSSIYKNVESNLYGNRKQNLPVVTKVSVERGTSESFAYGDKTDNEAYKVNFEIEYEEDLDYQTSGTVTLIHSNKKLEVAAME